MSTPTNPSKVVPAQLSFLAIYNPSLGPTDETFEQQLVFYYSRAAHDARVAAKKHARNDAAGGDALRAEENEKLRQIGLAQGMVDFAKSFSSGEPVDSIETEKSRIVLHELETGWWILASIDVTRLPSLSQSSTSSTSKTTADKTASRPSVEFSTREISPPHLLLQQLIQAHDLFCLHHGPSLHDLFVKLTRDKFTSTLDRFWTRFARTWDVLLHGNPAADIFGGIKLAAGGELGFGVGEEEWGSGEREVLEDLSRRTEGLVDLVIARFGEPASSVQEERKMEEDDEEALPWVGRGVDPVASDGLIFGGVAAITRQSLRDLSLWMRQVYMYGDQAYGIRDNPLRERRKRRRKDGAESKRQFNGPRMNEEPPPDEATGFSAEEIPQAHSTAQEASTMSNDDDQPKIPPPIISAASHTHPNPTAGADQEGKQQGTEDEEAIDEAGTTLGIPDQYMKYLTFGLSTLGKQKRPSTARRTSAASTITPQAQTRTTESKTTKSKASAAAENDNSSSMAHVDPMPDGEKLRSKIASQKKAENRGHFVIGLKGNLLELDELSEDDEQTEQSDGDDGIKKDGSRIVLRTIQVELTPRDNTNEDGNEALIPTPMSEDPPDGASYYRRVRVVLYVHRPFMYCFLFASRTSSLQYTGFYKNLHRNLVPIHRPMLNSTNVEKVRQRIESSQLLVSVEDERSEVRSLRSQKSTTTTRSPSRKDTMNTNPIYDLIYDPQRLTLCTSIPNIPLPGTPAAEGLSGLFKPSGSDAATSPSWTRIEALNVHSQILNTLASVKSRPNEVERTSKTVRGWWVVWMKVAASPSGANAHTEGDTSTVGKATSSVQTLQSNDAVAKGNDEENYRIAFLVRKATDAQSSAAPKPASTGSKAVSSMLEVMSLGMAGGQDDSAVGTGDGWGPAAPAGALAGGMGIDARQYVQGLLSLNR